MYTLTSHIQTGALASTVKCENACMRVCIVYMLLRDIVHSCVGLCICVPPQSSAEEPRSLINSDEWLTMVSPTPLSLSESFYLTPWGIMPCDVGTVLLS